MLELTLPLAETAKPRRIAIGTTAPAGRGPRPRASRRKREGRHHFKPPGDGISPRAASFILEGIP